jgi:hypothetical protein
MLGEEMTLRLPITHLASVAAALVLALSCRKPENKAAPAASSAPPQTRPWASSSGAPHELVEDDPGIKPVYPPLVGEPDGRAKRYCQALLELPAQRKAQCCRGSAGFTATGECLRTLTHALRSGAITIEAGALDRCVEAAEKSVEGCDWVGPAAPAAPEACRELLRGARDSGAACVSSLECKTGLFCRGLSAAQRGVCAPSGRPDEPCGSGIDGLVAYTRPPDWETSHRECSGYCLGRRCQPAVSLGGACKTNAQCEKGAICSREHCVAGSLPSRGQPCSSGECASGLRCIRGRCEATKPAGEACESDQECNGGCVTSDAGKKGRCGMKCSDTRAMDLLLKR